MCNLFTRRAFAILCIIAACIRLTFLLPYLHPIIAIVFALVSIYFAIGWFMHTPDAVVASSLIVLVASGAVPQQYVDFIARANTVFYPEKEMTTNEYDRYILGDSAIVVGGSKPTIHISSEGMLCSEGESTAYLIFHMNGGEAGLGPWAFSYYNVEEGVHNARKIVSATSPLKLKVQKAGTYRFVNDFMAHYHGEAHVDLAPSPTIEFDEDAFVCEGDTGIIHGRLNGTAPWKVTYSDGERLYEENIRSGELSLRSTKKITYTILSVTDKYCTSYMDVRRSVHIRDIPTISTPRQLCAGQPISVHIEGGTPPFVIQYAFTHFWSHKHTVNTSQRAFHIESDNTWSDKNMEIRVLQDYYCVTPKKEWLRMR